jgi:hypothetical protein
MSGTLSKRIVTHSALLHDHGNVARFRVETLQNVSFCSGNSLSDLEDSRIGPVGEMGRQEALGEEP